MTTEELSWYLGFSEEYIIELENSLIPLDIETFLKEATFLFNCDYNELFTSRTDDKTF